MNRFPWKHLIPMASAPRATTKENNARAISTSIPKREPSLYQVLYIAAGIEPSIMTTRTSSKVIAYMYQRLFSH